MRMAPIPSRRPSASPIWSQDCDLAWFEEPVIADDKPGMAEVRAGHLRAHRHRRIARRRASTSATWPCCAAADIFQPDPAFCGGITEAMRIARARQQLQPALRAASLGRARPASSRACICARPAPPASPSNIRCGANPMIHDLVDGRRHRPRRHDRHPRWTGPWLHAIRTLPGGPCEEELTMSEKNLLSDLAAHLYASSSAGQRAHAVGAGTGRAFRRQPGPDPRDAGGARGDADRRAAGEVGHLPDHRARPRSMRWRCLPRRAAARPDPDLRDGGTAQDPRDQGGGTGLLARDRGKLRAPARDPRPVGTRIAAGEALGEEDRDFHLEIVRATQNTRLLQCLLRSITRWACAACRSISAIPSACRQSHAEHFQIFEALLRRDGNLAQALMSAHLQGAEGYWKGLIARAAGRSGAGLSLMAHDLFHPSAAPRGDRHAAGRRRLSRGLRPDRRGHPGRRHRGRGASIVRAPAAARDTSPARRACAPPCAMARGST